VPSEHASAELLGAMSKLLTEVRATQLTLDAPGVGEARRVQAEVVDQLSDYVLPRLVQLDAPLLTVVGGSTGAGKSTLVNSLVGERVTESGVLRPTTRSPVLVHHPDDAEWFQPDRILPDLPRTNVVTNDTYALRLASSDRIPRGLAILDAPDVDSIDRGNRELAAQLLAACDLWLFVTSAARYADQVPWDYLRQAAERSTSVAVVLDRTSAEAVVEVRGHLARMMTSRGLSDSPLFTVPESPVDADGLLPRDAVAPIIGWLRELAGDSTARRMVMVRTLDGAVRHNVLRAHDLADALDEQIEVAEMLHGVVDTRYRKALEKIDRRSTDGSLMRGEVLARWQEFVGTGELLRSVEDKVSRIRDRFVDGVTGKRTRSKEVVDAIETGVHLLIVDQAERAAEKAARAWDGTPAGRALVGANRGLDRVSRDFRVRSERTVHDWRQAVLDLVRAESADKRMTPNFLAFGVKGLGVALMVVMFHRSADDTGKAAASRPDAVAQKLLDAIFGEDAVHEMVETIHTDLETRVAALLEAETQRFFAVLQTPDELKAAQAVLRDAARQAEYARHADFLNGETTP
jgi:energy-coupling factor transporter ATP-binding protein EcfA2